MNFNLSRQTAASCLFTLIGTLAVATAESADQKWWHTSSPNSAVNGQITLKNGNGATRTINNNPTGATLASRTANTQPPTVIVQATATLPVVTEGATCNNAVDTAGVNSDKTLILTCQSGVWLKALKSPNLYRYMFTSSTKWTVPAGVSSAFVTMAGGGASGAGWRISNATYTGSSGGYVFSQPVNLVAGETLQIVIGKGGQGYGPVSTGIPAQPGPPHYVYAPPNGDDGLGGYPGTSSILISPSAGVLLECSGGSGAYVGGVDNYTGMKVAGNIDGALIGSGSPSYPSPNRVATGTYVMANGPGACGLAQYGIGNPGSIHFSSTSGSRDGGKTPFGYGSGGNLSILGCYVTTTVIGTCIFPDSGRDGVMFIDVLY